MSLFYLNREGETVCAPMDPLAPATNYGVSLCLPELEAGEQSEDSQQPYQPLVYIYVEDFGQIESSNARGKEILEQEDKLEGETLFGSR